MFTRTFILLFALTLAIGHADTPPRQDHIVDGPAFELLTPTQMEPRALYYTDHVLSYDDWSKQDPQEHQAFVLYPGYVEPIVTVVKNGLRKQLTEHLMIFVARAKLRIDKPASQINLAAMTNLDSIQKFDGEIQHVQIQPNQFMGNVAGKGAVANFQWCNKTGPYIVRPTKEVDLSYTNPKDRAWCGDPVHSICVESCYLFNKYWYEGVKLANLALDDSEKKDYGIAMQSEIRYFTSEKDFGGPVPPSNLTGFTTPVRGGIEQNMFYFNQVLEFGKILVVVQDDPADPNKSLLSAFFVIGMKRRTYDQFSEVKNVLLGQSTLFNTTTGIAAGLPVFTRNMLGSIANVLER